VIDARPQETAEETWGWRATSTGSRSWTKKHAPGAIIWQDKWPRHLFIVIGIHGVVDAVVEGTTHSLRAQTQVVLAPSTPCKLKARTPSAIEILSLLFDAAARDRRGGV
jgi:hypothetical protein